MSMTLLSLVNKAKQYINPELSNFTTGQTAHLKHLVNTAIGSISLDLPIQELKSSSTIVTKADYSTGTITVVNGSKSVAGGSTVWTYKHIGMKIRFTNDRDFYTIENVSSNTALSLDRVYLGTSLTDETYTIFDNTAQLPSDCNWIKGVFNYNNGIMPLEPIEWDEIDKIDPALQHSSDMPERYAEIGAVIKKEPYTSVYTLDTGSTTTSAIISSLKADEDDYYKGWDFINVTRGISVKVLSYTATTTTLTLDEAVTAQVATDSCYLISNLNNLAFYRRPTSQIGLGLKYFKKHDKLINDYDIAILPDEFEDMIVAGVLKDYYGKDEMASVYGAKFSDEMAILKRKYATTADNRRKLGRRQPTGGRTMTFNVQD